jgi:hypothetical protein
MADAVSQMIGEVDTSVIDRRADVYIQHKSVWSFSFADHIRKPV